MVYSTCQMNCFSRVTRWTTIPLLNEIPNTLLQLNDNRLEVYFLTELLASSRHRPIPNVEAVIEAALSHFKHFDDPDLKCMSSTCIVSWLH
jgi:hypothetical protein